MDRLSINLADEDGEQKMSTERSCCTFCSPVCFCMKKEETIANIRQTSARVPAYIHRSGQQLVVEVNKDDLHSLDMGTRPRWTFSSENEDHDSIQTLIVTLNDKDQCQHDSGSCSSLVCKHSIPQSQHDTEYSKSVVTNKAKNRSRHATSNSSTVVTKYATNQSKDDSEYICVGTNKTMDRSKLDGGNNSVVEGDCQSKMVSVCNRTIDCTVLKNNVYADLLEDKSDDDAVDERDVFMCETPHEESNGLQAVVTLWRELNDMKNLNASLSSNETQPQNLKHDLCKETKLQNLENYLNSYEIQQQNLKHDLNSKETKLQNLENYPNSNETQPQNLKNDLNSKETQPQNPECDVNSKGTQPQNLKIDLNSEEAQPQNTGSGLNSRETQPQDTGSGLKNKETQPQNLERSQINKETQHQNLENDLDSKEAQPQNTGSDLSTKEVQPQNIGSSLNSKETQPQNLGKGLNNKETKPQNLERSLNNKETQPQNIERSLNNNDEGPVCMQTEQDYLPNEQKTATCSQNNCPSRPDGNEIRTNAPKTESCFNGASIKPNILKTEPVCFNGDLKQKASKTEPICSQNDMLKTALQTERLYSCGAILTNLPRDVTVDARFNNVANSGRIRPTRSTSGQIKPDAYDNADACDPSATTATTVKSRHGNSSHELGRTGFQSLSPAGTASEAVLSRTDRRVLEVRRLQQHRALSLPSLALKHFVSHTINTPGRRSKSTKSVTVSSATPNRRILPKPSTPNKTPREYYEEKHADDLSSSMFNKRQMSEKDYSAPTGDSFRQKREVTYAMMVNKPCNLYGFFPRPSMQSSVQVPPLVLLHHGPNLVQLVTKEKDDSVEDINSNGGGNLKHSNKKLRSELSNSSCSRVAVNFNKEEMIQKRIKTEPAEENVPSDVPPFPEITKKAEVVDDLERELQDVSGATKDIIPKDKQKRNKLLGKRDLETKPILDDLESSSFRSHHIKECAPEHFLTTCTSKDDVEEIDQMDNLMVSATELSNCSEFDPNRSIVDQYLEIDGHKSSNDLSKQPDYALNPNYSTNKLDGGTHAFERIERNGNMVKNHEIQNITQLQKVFYCCLCHQQFRRKYYLQKHLKRVHGIGNMKNFIWCFICGNQFARKPSFQEHIVNDHAIHSGTLNIKICPHCGEMLPETVSYKTHAEEHYAKTIFVCSFPGCRKRIMGESRLKQHIAKIHSKNKSAETKRTFMQKEITNYKDRQFPCTWPKCGKMFVAKRNLIIHMRIHNDEKPVACQFCEYRCRQTAALNWHLKKHGINKYEKQDIGSKNSTKYGKSEIAKERKIKRNVSNVTPENG